MRNPFRTEAEAFRFVWLTIIYFALIVIASLINTWLGVGVFIGETAILIWWIVTRRRRGPRAGTGFSSLRTRRWVARSS
jgi:hypothetical protein